MREEVIPVLRVSDARHTAAWYARLDFATEWEHRYKPGLPLFMSIARGDVRLYLSEHTGDARPDTLLHLNVHNVDTIAAEFGVRAHNVSYGREVELTDPDGNRLRITTRND